MCKSQHFRFCVKTALLASQNPFGLKAHSDSLPQRVKYFWGALNLNYNFSYSCGRPATPQPLTPLDINRWGTVESRGAWLRGKNYCLCDMFFGNP